MPARVDPLRIKDPFLDKRRKLLPCQEEMVHYWYKVMGRGIREISRAFKVDKRLIQFTLFPERKKRNVELRHERGGSKIYYVREEHAVSMKAHRHYKQAIFQGHDVPSSPEQGQKDKQNALVQINVLNMIVKGKEDFGIVIKKIRQEKGLTLKKVADDNPDLFYDLSHLDKTEQAIQSLRGLDRMSELLKYYGYAFHILPLDQ